jgi:hypothetical protein
MEIDVDQNKLSNKFKEGDEASIKWWEEEILPALQVYIHGPTEGSGRNESANLFLTPRITDAILLLAMFVLLMVASTFF